jgi:EAL domain-containing protein (putative c-di-GMP-specific phosphodiesterase class I)
VQVVAEGVETEAVAAALRASLCDELQGFLYAKPLPPDDVPDWIAKAQSSGIKLLSA